MDEAGRGAVLGPMVIAGILIRGDDEEKLRSLGVRDSKKLTPAVRASLYPRILNLALNVEILKLEPRELDNAIIKRRRKGGLNHLEAVSMIYVINRLKPNTVYVDTPHPDPMKFKALITSGLRVKDVNVVCEHRADEKYPVVSAASVIAKVERDRAIARIKEVYGEVGSGYPSDATTKRFLIQWYSRFKCFPSFVRRSWKSIRRVREECRWIKLI
ncbi:MAG: ribonuclease HII [Candidatus Nezhaarchaeales archaeon]